MKWKGRGGYGGRKELAMDLKDHLGAGACRARMMSIQRVLTTTNGEVIKNAKCILKELFTEGTSKQAGQSDIFIRKYS